MNINWMVVFGTEGMEMLVPYDEILNRHFLNFGGGPTREMNSILSIAYLKVRHNAGRRPEIWVYNTEEGYSEEEMRAMWDQSPQGMADLVRAKGKLLFRERFGETVIR